ncbi:MULTISPECIES: hypothetical protein [unclassified Streptomyces]|uniref:hypothetical protein n=1 Tax=unclassified Streptomyces TaxID=2593676 RepID=UPI00224FD0D5|nr:MULTISPECIES: hypothetical protein [unclassified Streptomyces]MCX4409884.1 hypothetical protein [Streptomyces sp. NBC_01764]MCX5191657.1 hypothetical protein [Streptomyces sp. NBC_00268]
MAVVAGGDTTAAFLAALTGHWHRSAQARATRRPGLRAYQHPAAAAGRTPC